MGRYALLTLLTLLLCHSAGAQSVRGTVVDQARRPLAGVAVVMLGTDSLYLGGVTTDTLGRFAIASAVRPYRLLFQHLACEPRTVDDDRDAVGEIVLRENANVIGAVEIAAERPLVRIEPGGLSYDLEALSKDRAVNNAYEALTRLPGVSERNGRLELAGMGTVRVILDGKPSTMSAEQLAALLRATPVERIEKAEVLYSAPPHYHVRGAAINLVLRRSREHTLTGEVHGGYTARYYNNWEAGGNLVFTSPDWSADLTYATGQSEDIRLIDLYSRHTLTDGTHDISQLQRITGDATVHNLRAAAEYAPEGKGRLSAAYTGNFTPHGTSFARASGSQVTSRSDARGDHALHNLALRYTAPFGLDLSADYTRYRTASQMAMQNNYADGTRTAFDTQSGQTVNRLSLKLDQAHTLGTGWQLTYGTSFDLAEDHDWQHYTLHEGDFRTADTDSRLREYTANLYAGFGRQFARVGFSLSLTGEYYRLEEYDNWSLYPQASLLWMPSADHMLQFTLSSNKSYPSYWEMQESVTYIDGYSEAHGTPGLRPSHNYSGQLMYILRQKYIFMLFWNFQSDYFVQTVYQTPDRLALVYQSHNWDLNRQMGMNAIVPFRIGQWLDSRLTLTGMRMHQRCDRFHDIGFDRTRWLGIARMENTLRLCRKPDLALDISAYYQSRAIQGTYDVDPSWGVDAGAKWTFAKGRATLSARCTDLFESTLPFAKVRYKGQYLDMDSGAYTRAFTVRFSLRLGGYKEKKRSEVDTSRFGH